ncbi:UDP-Glycosyltransferase/glycogen phosphorylase [Rhizophagus irregularis]|uniref:UDP-Glycosyltransferase/glycogen phosphorylase n=1 Tax=Rhizophagus irregularis TaxID=588596 RepID=A0A2N0RJ67_9GLOM|nr:UDP-Glycosyltransferase/glycogen phosphorylase [Rhizophagus irregularis]
MKNFKNNVEFDYKGLPQILEPSTNDYKKTYEKYKKTAKEYNIDLFICDVLANEACIDAANNLKKPVVGWTSFLQFMDPVPYKDDPVYGCNTSLENESFFERFRCALIQPLQVASKLGPFAHQLNDIRKQMNIEPSGKIPKVSLSLVDTFFGFELPQHLAPNVQEVGPVLPEEYPPITPELSNFMNAHERVLYIAFTSRDNFYPTLNLTDGTQVQTLSILNNKHPHIHITNFAPQFAVLNHTNTKLFFSHGGAGSAHESLYTGTPMLVLPLGGDQMGNAQKLKTAGVALTLSVYNLNVNDILNKMSKLLEDEKIKKNLKRMEVLTKINSKRKYRAADLIEYILHSSGLEEYINDDYLKEWAPAASRMGFIKANNLDVYGALLGIVLTLIGGIVFKLFKLISNPSSIRIKSKKA